ncbi:MAG TPA: L,D-transpeptidase [Bauldia sp.]|nr:L,D-transpeptidase [Bauldia sp.]
MTTLFALLAALQLFIFGPEKVPPQIADAVTRAGITATVSIADQRMYVVVIDAMGLKKTYAWKVSTGKDGFETPTGDFQPTRVAAEYYSKTYDNAPMPHAVFFTGGYAVHATEAVGKLGAPASHGCVRLAPENAAMFFDLVEAFGTRNTRIAVKA